MVEAGCAEWRRGAAFALPGIQTDMVVIAASGEKGRLVAEPPLQLKPEHAAIKSKCTVEVRYLQMNMANADTRIDRTRR